MSDILIRDIPDDVLAAIEAKARRAGLSRSEYLRRLLERDHISEATQVSVDCLRRVANLLSDLEDPDVMDDAWS